MPGKYKFVNGVMVDTSATPSAPPAPTSSQLTASAPAAPVPLAVICTQDDMAQAQADGAAQGVAVNIPVATAAAISAFDDPAFAAKYKCAAGKQVDTDHAFEQVSEVFARYEVPIGLLNKVMALAEFNANMIVDDSYSMRSKTGGTVKQSCPYMKAFLVSQGRALTDTLSRWEEAEDMMHIMIDLLAYLPTGNINIHFLNRSTVINIARNGMLPVDIAAKAHAEVRTAFTTAPNGGTPLKTKLLESFNSARVPTMHYLFTDGEPSDCIVSELQRLIMNRAYPDKNPLTLVGCTDEEEDIKWMETMEVNAPYVCAIDYYEEERSNILALQGPVFPYTKGLWLLCLLVGAINPDDLDDLDSPHPLTKCTLDNLMGRHITPEEYGLYWSNNPHGQELSNMFSRFANEQTCARMITGRRSGVVQSGVAGVASQFARMGMRW